MDLFGKVVIMVIVIIAVAGIFVALKGSVQNQAHPLNATQAQNFVINYMRQTFPNAQVYPINVTRSQLMNNSWDIFVGVVFNYTSSCPTIEIEDFDYPAVNIQPRTDNIYSRGCTLYSGQINLYGMNLPAAAMVDAYSASTAARNYVQTYGYSNVMASARFYQSYNQSPLGTINNAWVVRYNTTASRNTLYVILNQFGFLLGNYTA